MTPLCELADKHKTLKHSKCGYTEHFHTLLKDTTEDTLGVIELGVLHGASLRMWRDYFPNAEIYGVDKIQDRCFSDDRIRCFCVDIGKKEDYREILSALEGRQIDLVVDDCSHIFEHQLLAMSILKELLRHDGLYIVEDVHTHGKFNVPPLIDGFSFKQSIKPAGKRQRAVVYQRTT